MDNTNGTFDKNFTFDSNGYVNWTVLKEYFQKDINGDKDGNDAGERIDYGPYNLTVSKQGYQTAYAQVEMTDSKTVIITLTDIESPRINHTSLTSANIGQSINITANVTDNAAVDSIYLNYTEVNGTYSNVSMTKWNSNWSYEIPGQDNIGIVQYFILANDTSGNANMTSIYQIQVVDVTAPKINHVPVVAANVFDAINITANVTDDITVNEVLLNYTDVIGIPHNVTMNRWDGNFSFDVPGQVSTGFVDYFIWANDTSDNANMTTLYQIQIYDVTNPMFDHVPVASEVVGQAINITAEVTDDMAVDSVRLNYTDVHGVNQNVSMNRWGSNYSFDIPGQTLSGLVGYFIWANDSSGNDNRTQAYQIQIRDVTSPEIYHVPIASVNVSQIINITANVTDDVAVNSVHLNYTGVNGIIYNVSMVKSGENYSYEIPGQNSIGNVQYFIWANDSDGNDNRTVEHSILINDVVKPEIIHVPVASANVGEVIDIVANVSDDVSVGSVFLNYTGVDGINHNVSMVIYVDGWQFKVMGYIILGQTDTGTVNYFIWANDTSGNANRTQEYLIEIVDVTGPIIEHTPAASALVGWPVNISALVMDDVEVGSVYLNYTCVDGTSDNVTMNEWNDRWYYDIPAQNHAGVLSYFIWANDTSGNVNRTGVFEIMVNDAPIYDTTPPRIISTTPTGINVSVSTAITITFNESMNTSSVESAITISPIFTISSYSWSADNTTLTISPSVNLSYNTTYNVTIGIGAKDIAGNNLASAYSWEFTTQLAPTINNPDGGIGEFWWIILIIIVAAMVAVYLFQRFRKEKEREEPEAPLEKPE